MVKVKFKNDTFGIRVPKGYDLNGAPVYIFLDLTSPDVWWQRDYRYFKDCQGTEEQVDVTLERLDDIGVPV